jgi:hypothetical protein
VSRTLRVPERVDADVVKVGKDEDRSVSSTYLRLVLQALRSRGQLTADPRAEPHDEDAEIATDVGTSSDDDAF